MNISACANFPPPTRRSRRPHMATKEDIDEIAAIIAREFPSFGGGKGAGAGFNPLAEWMKDEPPVFALNVDIRAVVERVITLAPAEPVAGKGRS